MCIRDRMETQSALVWADRAVHLHTESTIHLHLAGVVDPRNPEDDDPFRLNHPVRNAGLEIFRVPVEDRPHRLDDFANCLMELELRSALLNHIVHERFYGLLLHLVHPFMVWVNVQTIALTW